MVLGGSYVIPLMHGRLEEQTMREIISSPSFDHDSLEREYISRWSGAQSGAIFSPNTITTLRKIVRAEYKRAELKEDEFYVVSADMAKDGSADTAVIVFRVTPKEYMFNFRGVNLFTINSTDYEVVANELKKIIALYDARLFVYDANGIKSLSLFAFLVNHQGILNKIKIKIRMLTVKPKHYAIMSKVA